MTTPCESKTEINEIRKAQTEQGKDIAVVKDSTDRLRVEQAAFISESREVIGLLKEMAIEGKQTQRAFKEAQDVLFQKARENAKDIRDLQNTFVEHRLTAKDEITGIVKKVLTPAHEEIEAVKVDVKTLMDERIQGQGKWMVVKDVRVVVSTAGAVIAVFAVLWDHIVELFTP